MVPDSAQLDLLDVAELVGEVGVDDRALAFLQEFDEAAGAAACVLEDRQRDVDPPLFAGELVQQFLLLADRGDRQLFKQTGGDRLYLST